MKRLVLGFAAAAMLGLGTLAGTADAANGRAVHAAHAAHVTHVAHGARAYHLAHGVRFSGGYYYRGQDHHHWTRRVWDPVHSRWNYWDPNLNVNYYWYAPGNCYYPVTYCP